MGYGKSPSCEQPDPYLFSAARRATFSAPRRRQRLGRYLDRNENFVLVWPACGGAGALRTLENARRSARSTRDSKGEALV
jgi:hypothetical protein